MTRLQDFLNSEVPAVAVIRGRVVRGDVFGIEVECEGRAVDWDGMDAEIIQSWDPNHDGSLRANHGSAQEWVFKGPVKYEKAVERVHDLFRYFEKRKAQLVPSNRTSVHIHFNVGDKSAYQVVNIFILFTILEGLFDRFCGDDRTGNLFCLSSRYAEDQIRWVEDSCFKNYGFRFREEQRYTALNLASINKFGTVEFRGMRGVDNKQDLLDWLSIVNEFCDYACYKVKNPVTLLETISVNRPLGLVKEIFSQENFLKLTKGIDEHEIDSSIYEGLRLVQLLCYKIGAEFDEVRLRGKDFWESFNKNDPVVEPVVRKKQARPFHARNPFDAFLQGRREGRAGLIQQEWVNNVFNPNEGDDIEDNF